jgi:hypothetical protein
MTGFLVEAYVETLTIPAETPRRVVESYVEALTIPTETPRRVVESYVEALTSTVPTWYTTGSAPISVASTSATTTVLIFKTTGLAPVVVATTSNATPILRTNGMAPIVVSSVIHISRPSSSDVYEYLSQNIGAHLSLESRIFEYLTENVGIDPIKTHFGIEYLYENVLGLAWYGAPAYVDTPNEDVSGGEMNNLQTYGGVGMIYSSYVPPQEMKIVAVRVLIEFLSDTTDGADLHWKLEDIGETTNGTMLSINRDSSVGQFSSEPGATVVAHQWVFWDNKDALTTDEIVTLTAAFAKGQVVLTASPGGEGFRRVSSVLLALTLGSTATGSTMA